MKKLSVVIPAYKEEGRIEKTLREVSGFLKNQPFQYEILVVVDGDKDNTAGLVKSLIPDLPNLQLIDNRENHGKGYVVKQGILKSTGDVKLFMDADNSTSVDQVIPMLKFLENGFDVVIGSIEIQGAKVNEHAQWYRRALGHWSKYLIRAVAGLWDVHDTQRGFKVFNAEAANKIFSRATIKRFGFDIEILAIAEHLGYKIKEVPVVWNNAGASTVNLGSYFATFSDLIKVRMNLWGGKYK